MIGRTAVVAATLAVVLTASTAFAAGMTLTSQHLAAATLAVPVFYPQSIVAANGAATIGKPEINDTVTVGYSAQMNASTLCTSAPTQFLPFLMNVSVTITSKAAPSGNDQLAISPVDTGTCAGDGIVHFGTVDLGATGYVTSGTTTFTGSTFSLTQTPISATIVITLGLASGSATAQVTTGGAAVYTPDPALTDTAGNGIGLSSAATAATTQF
jgi:hypothetical protein